MPLATIPAFGFPSLKLGPLEIQSFGVLTALGIIVAVQLAMRGAREQGRDPAPLLDFSIWGVLGGVLLGHAVHVLAYHREELSLYVDGRFNWDVLKFWVGLSSMGGLLGGILAAIVYFRLYRKIPFAPFGDAFALGIAPGWGVARVGCFTVHDHPGVESNFFLAVVQHGSPRHDLGFYDALVLFTIGAVLWTLHRKKLLRGRLLPLLAVLYGVPRFFLDFLRARQGDLYADGTPIYADGRQLGLTFAQYFAIGLVVYGAFRLATRKAAGAGKTPKRAAVG
jgi:phosphatidylglycerol---prolipoprotein diacylglyceryl transferase